MIPRHILDTNLTLGSGPSGSEGKAFVYDATCWDEVLVLCLPR